MSNVVVVVDHDPIQVVEVADIVGGAGGGGGGAPSGPAGGDLAGTYPSPQIAAGVIVNHDIANNADIGIEKIWGLEDALDGKSPVGHTHATDTSLIPKSLVDGKGDLIVGSAADAVARLPVGTTAGHVLTVDSAASFGVKWAAPAGGAAVDEVLALAVGAPVPAGTPTGTLIVRYQ